MEIQAAAGIDILGATLRYAEVDRANSRYRLLRLGSCSFDFDVVRELVHRDSPQHLSVVAEALRDVLRGATSRHLRIAIHPRDAYAFTTPVPSELDAQARQKRLERETALVVGQPEAAQLQVSAQVTRSEAQSEHEKQPGVHPEREEQVEEQVNWTQALALPQVVNGRIERVIRSLPHHSHEWMLSTEGAAQIARWTEQQRKADLEEAPPFSLVIGWYGAHAEYVVLREGAWYYGHHADTESAGDCAYFATALLNRLGVSIADVGRIYLYGRELDLEAFAPLQAVFGVAPQRLDPLAVVGISPEEMDNHFEPEDYAPCIGVAL